MAQPQRDHGSGHHQHAHQEHCLRPAFRRREPHCLKPVTDAPGHPDWLLIPTDLNVSGRHTNCLRLLGDFPHLAKTGEGFAMLYRCCDTLHWPTSNCRSRAN